MNGKVGEAPFTLPHFHTSHTQRVSYSLLFRYAWQK